MSENKEAVVGRMGVSLSRGIFKLFSCGMLTGFIFLMGCGRLGVGEPGPDNREATEIQLDSLLAEAELNYEVPVSVPNILVNQMGYLKNSEKIAVFRGDIMPETFQIIEAETQEVVFEGTVEEQGYNTYTDEAIGYGTFTGLTGRGVYYVEAKVVGRSYFFAIGDHLYDSVFQSACKQYYYSRCGIPLTDAFARSYAHSACHTQEISLREDAAVNFEVSGGWHQDETGSRDVSTVCRVVNTLLLSYEFNSELFRDRSREDTASAIPESGNQIPDLLDEVRYATDWLMKMQDGMTGGVYAGVTVYQPEGVDGTSALVEPVSLEATAMFCAAMAKFSYIYQDYDTDYATKCLKAADRAWRYLELNHDGSIEDALFLAAAELYRAVGYQTYHRMITQYLSKNEYQNHWNETIMMGCVTYLSTKMKVDKELCSTIMKVIMQKAEELTAESRQSQYLIAGSRQQDNNGALLEATFCLSIVNHIIKNHEYGTVIENHLHYLMGRNPAGISYIDGAGAKNYRELDAGPGITNQPESNSKLIFMLSEIISNSNIEE